MKYDMIISVIYFPYIVKWYNERYKRCSRYAAVNLCGTREKTVL
jgi:hypothetical protein